jgi:hypothetical protein
MDLAMAVQFREQALDHAARRLDGDVIMFAPPSVQISALVALAALGFAGFAVANIKVPDSYSATATTVADKGVLPIIARESGIISAVHFWAGQDARSGATIASIDVTQGSKMASKHVVAFSKDDQGLVCCQSANIGMAVKSGDLLFGILPRNTNVSIIVEVPPSVATHIAATNHVRVRSETFPFLQSTLAKSITRVSSPGSQAKGDRFTTFKIEFNAVDQPALQRAYAQTRGTSFPVVLELPDRALLSRLATRFEQSTDETAAARGN